MPALDQRGAVLQNGVHALHDAVGRQAAVLHGQVHAAARGDHAHAELVGRRKLRAEQITAPGREDIVVIEAGRAAVFHQLAHAGQRGSVHDLGIEVFPDLIERLEPGKQFKILYLRQIARELLIKMVVRINEAGIAQQMGAVQHLVGLNGKIRADGADTSVLAVQVDVPEHAVRIVAGDHGVKIANEQGSHTGSSFVRRGMRRLCFYSSTVSRRCQS